MHRPREGQTQSTEITEEDRAQGDRIASLVNDLLGRFNDVFSSHQFLRMRTMNADFDPRMFMQNFSQNFGGNDDSILEMVRRMSEQEAEKNRMKKKPSKEAVDKLAIIKIEPKHCQEIG